MEGILRQCDAFTDGEIAGAQKLMDHALQHPESDEYLFFVAEGEGSVWGYVCYGDAPFTDGVYDVYWLAVHPARLGLGVGRALLEAAEGDVRDRGGRMLLIDTASKPSYDMTRAFYEHLGYRETARVRDYYRVGDDKVIYAKRLGSLPR